MVKDEDVVMKTKRLYEGLSKNSSWFAGLSDKRCAGIERDGKGIWMTIDDVYVASIEPSDDMTVDLYVRSYDSDEDICDDTITFHSYGELGNGIQGFLDDFSEEFDHYSRQRAGE